MISFGGFENNSNKYENGNSNKANQFEEEKHEDSSPLDSPPQARTFPKMRMESPFQLTLGISIHNIISLILILHSYRNRRER